jgi:hypothetical protein
MEPRQVYQRGRADPLLGWKKTFNRSTFFAQFLLGGIDARCEKASISKPCTIEY